MVSKLWWMRLEQGSDPTTVYAHLLFPSPVRAKQFHAWFGAGHVLGKRVKVFPGELPRLMRELDLPAELVAAAERLKADLNLEPLKNGKIDRVRRSDIIDALTKTYVKVLELEGVIPTS